MSILEVSMIHHVGIVLFVLFLLSSINYCHPFVYFVSLIYLYLVHERYMMRLKRKLQFEERKQANQKRALCDSETVRWLNHAVEKMWPVCMEQIASQQVLLPIIPWFLDKYKPWTAKKALVQHLYLGRNPPLFTEMRVLRDSTDDDHLVLELGMNFLTADDMSALLAVKLRKRLGFGMWAKLHMTGMHVEGKVLIGVKFLRKWPYLERLRVCFAEPPYFQMNVKPIFTHGLDVTELPGIAGWIDKLLSLAFEQTLVEPNMLVVNVEKFVSQGSEDWFCVDEKDPVAYAKVEVLEASDMKPSDLNGLADPYVKGRLGPHRFKTKIQKKTLSPKWQEEFKIPICTWESANTLVLEVRDKDHFVDDTLGDCSVNISDLRDGQRHDMWLPLEKIKMGQLRLAITILEDTEKGGDKPHDEETQNQADSTNSYANDSANKSSFSSVSSAKSEKSPRFADNYEPINIEGQEETGIWICQPGSGISQTWEPRKGKSRRLDTQIQTSGPLTNDSSSTDESLEGKPRMNSIRRGLQKICSVFNRSTKEDTSTRFAETIPSPRPNIRAVNEKDIGVKLIVEDTLSAPDSDKVPKEDGMAKSILKHAGKSARTIKHALSRKGLRESQGDSLVVTEQDIYVESDSSDDESLSPPGVEGIPILINSNIQLGSSNPKVENEVLMMKTESPERTEADKVKRSDNHGDRLVEK